MLKQDARFFTEGGQLLRNAVYEAAMKTDAKLIRMLLDAPATRERFFTKAGDCYVFDKIGFGWVINNRQFLPDSYTRYKNKIGLVDHRGDYITNSEEVELVFPFKDCILEGGQTKDDQKRNEIFYNETLAPDEVDRLLDPKVLTNVKRYSSDGEEAVSVFSPGDNLLVKGNNLLVLASLRKRFAAKVRCIYIDPPFNTGNDSFQYNDKFKRSTWLTFMKNRLRIAKDLLTQDGNIFIHIDSNQSHYLKVLCDEIFGEQNFVEEIIWAYGSPSGGRSASAKPVNIHDYILHYCKDYQEHKQNRVYIPYSKQYISSWFKYKDENGRVYQKRQRGKDENGQTIWEHQYLDESKGVPLSTVWNDIKQVYADPRAYKASQAKHTEIVRSFRGGQKPEALIKRILEMSTDEGDLVLDFHIGTGTTCAVAHKMNRRYIGVEQMDYINDFTVNRLNKIIQGDPTGISKEVGWNGGGSFVYCELAKYNQKFMDQIDAASSVKDLDLIWSQMKDTAMLSSSVYPKDIDPKAKDFQELSLDDQKHLLISLLDKNLLYVNYSDRNDQDYAIPETDRLFSESFYQEA